MHGHANLNEFLSDISGFLGCYYLALAIMNLAAGLYVWLRAPVSVPRQYAMPRIAGPIWLTFCGVFTVMAVLAFSGKPSWMACVTLPLEWRESMDKTIGLVVFSVGTVLLMLALFVCRRFFVRPAIAWILLNAALLFMGLSLTDPDFKAIVAKPDNVPIVGMIFLLGFFTWVATLRAVPQRRTTGARPRAVGSGRQRQSIGVARLGVYRTDLHGRIIGVLAGVGDWITSPIGATGQQ